MDTGPQQIRTMETLIARCLTDPVFLEGAVRSPRDVSLRVADELKLHALDLDFRKLQCFSGFISKVQHNYLWEHFPATRRLLWKLGIEHDVFVQYRKIQLSASPKASDRQARIRQFCEFLGHYASGPSFGLLRCVLMHEKILWELRSAKPKERPPCNPWDCAGIPWSKVQRMVPGVSSHVRISTFKYDPTRVLAALSNIEMNLSAIRRKPITLLYALDSTSTVRTFNLDPVSGAVVGAITGRQSVRSVISRVRRSGFDWIKPSAFRSVFEQLVTAGFLVWEGEPCE
jgi:hypothetical protein